MNFDTQRKIDKIIGYINFFKINARLSADLQKAIFSCFTAEELTDINDIIIRFALSQIKMSNANNIPVSVNNSPVPNYLDEEKIRELPFMRALTITNETPLIESWKKRTTYKQKPFVTAEITDYFLYGRAVYMYKTGDFSMPKEPLLLRKEENFRKIFDALQLFKKEIDGEQTSPSSKAFSLFNDETTKIFGKKDFDINKVNAYLYWLYYTEIINNLPENLKTEDSRAKREQMRCFFENPESGGKILNYFEKSIPRENALAAYNFYFGCSFLPETREKFAEREQAATEKERLENEEKARIAEEKRAKIANEKAQNEEKLRLALQEKQKKVAETKAVEEKNKKIDNSSFKLNQEEKSKNDTEKVNNHSVTFELETFPYSVKDDGTQLFKFKNPRPVNVKKVQYALSYDDTCEPTDFVSISLDDSGKLPIKIENFKFFEYCYIFWKFEINGGVSDIYKSKIRLKQYANVNYDYRITFMGALKITGDINFIRYNYDEKIGLPPFIVRSNCLFNTKEVVINLDKHYKFEIIIPKKEINNPKSSLFVELYLDSVKYPEFANDFKFN